MEHVESVTRFLTIIAHLLDEIVFLINSLSSLREENKYLNIVLNFKLFSEILTFYMMLQKRASKS